MDFVYLGQAIKTEAIEESMRKAQVNADEVAYMGDASTHASSGTTATALPAEH